MRRLPTQFGRSLDESIRIPAVVPRPVAQSRTRLPAAHQPHYHAQHGDVAFLAVMPIGYVSPMRPRQNLIPPKSGLPYESVAHVLAGAEAYTFRPRAFQMDVMRRGMNFFPHAGMARNCWNSLEMVARRPYVRVHALAPEWSDAAFDALYGLDGRYGEFSSNRAGSSNARSPYTSSVLMWWNRTSYLHAASNSRIVPSTFVRMNGSGSKMELSLCDSAAKCTMASQPGCAFQQRRIADIADDKVRLAITATVDVRQDCRIRQPRPSTVTCTSG